MSVCARRHGLFENIAIKNCTHIRGESKLVFYVQSTGAVISGQTW